MANPCSYQFHRQQIATDLKEQGFLYWREGSGWSISPNVLTGIEVWLKLCKDQALSAQELKKLSTLLVARRSLQRLAGRKLAILDAEQTYTLTDIQEPVIPVCEQGDPVVRSTEGKREGDEYTLHQYVVWASLF